MKKFLLTDKQIQLPALPGVEIDGEYLAFPDTYSIEEISKIRKRIQKGKADINIEPTRKAYKPTEDEQNAILQKVDSLEGFGFYEAVAAQTYIDRHRDILSRAFLELMRQKYEEGRAIVHNHSHSYPVGYTFGATIEELPDSQAQLIVKFYISPNALLISGQNALKSLQDGLIRRVSVSFSSPSVSYTPSDESPDGQSFWTYNIPEEGADKVEVYELSLVTMGAQQGAIIKGDDTQNGPIGNSPTFGEIETKSNKMELRNIEIYGNKTLDLPEDQVSKADEIKKEIDEKIKTLSDQLKAYQDKEAKEIEEKAIELVNLKKEVLGDSVNAETEKALASKLTLEELEGQITQMKSLKKKSVNQTNPDPEPVVKSQDDGIYW